MNRATLGVLAILCSTWTFGCGSDGGSGTGGTGGAGGVNSGGSGGQSSLCQAGCVATLQAACSNGPTTQAQCVADCEGLESGSCGTEYGALQTCAVGQAITCNSAGIPIVEACTTEQDALIACLN